MSTFDEGAVVRAGDGKFAEKPPAPEAAVELDEEDGLDGEDAKCRECGEPNDDGDGYDGLCASCADAAEEAGEWDDGDDGDDPEFVTDDGIEVERTGDGTYDGYRDGRVVASFTHTGDPEDHSEVEASLRAALVAQDKSGPSGSAHEQGEQR